MYSLPLGDSSDVPLIDVEDMVIDNEETKGMTNCNVQDLEIRSKEAGTLNQANLTDWC